MVLALLDEETSTSAWNRGIAGNRFLSRSIIHSDRAQLAVRSVGRWARNAFPGRDLDSRIESGLGLDRPPSRHGRVMLATGSAANASAAASRGAGLLQEESREM
jgi:hypothetical protein